MSSFNKRHLLAILVLCFITVSLAQAQTISAEITDSSIESEIISTEALAETQSTEPDYSLVINLDEIADFPDVKSGSPYFVASKFLKAHQIIEGYPDGTFQPNKPINRAEALKILNRAFLFQQHSQVEKPLSSLKAAEDQTTNNCQFPDVYADQWYYNYVCQAFNNQVVEGYPDGTFKPEQTINKVEALKMALLQSGLPFTDDTGDIYSDVNNDEWYFPIAKMAKQKTLYVPDKQNYLHAGTTLNRGEFAALIYRIIKFEQANVEFGKTTFYGQSFDGRNTASGQKLNMSEYQAAHKSLPFGTKVKVTNLANGKSIVATVIDRGPYVHGYIIDLTTGAFAELASLGTGVINTEVEIVN
jgi:rare lipoprotein A